MQKSAFDCVAQGSGSLPSECSTRHSLSASFNKCTLASIRPAAFHTKLNSHEHELLINDGVRPYRSGSETSDKLKQEAMSLELVGRLAGRVMLVVKYRKEAEEKNDEKNFTVRALVSN